MSFCPDTVTHGAHAAPTRRNIITIIDIKSCVSRTIRAMIRAFASQLLGCSARQSETHCGYYIFDSSKTFQAISHPLRPLTQNVAKEMFSDFDKSCAAQGADNPTSSIAAAAEFASEQLFGLTGSGANENAVFVIGPVPSPETASFDLTAIVRKLAQSSTVWVNTLQNSNRDSPFSTNGCKVVPLAAVGNPKPKVPFEIILRCLLSRMTSREQNPQKHWVGRLRLQINETLTAKPSHSETGDPGPKQVYLGHIKLWPLVGTAHFGLMHSFKCVTVLSLVPKSAERADWFANTDALSCHAAHG